MHFVMYMGSIYGQIIYGQGDAKKEALKNCKECLKAMQ